MKTKLISESTKSFTEETQATKQEQCHESETYEGSVY